MLPGIAGAQAAWVPQAIRVPGGVSSSLAAVSCVSRQFCMASGTLGFASRITAPLIARWTGSGRQAARLARPRWAQTSSLTGISCTSTTACSAVGQFVTWKQLSIVLVERWDGLRWRRERVATPPGYHEGMLNDIACTSEKSCTAVGETDTNPNVTYSLVEHWNGKTWSLQPLVSSPMSDLSGVACPTEHACIAVGTGLLDTGGVVCNQAIATSWNGRAWSTQVLYQPTLDQCTFSFPGLRDVSCPSPGLCTAVGCVGGDSSPDEPLAFGLHGATWTDQNPPIPSADGGFDSVSCALATACTAVGSNGDGTAPFTEAWHGTGWSQRQASPERAWLCCRSPRARARTAARSGRSALAPALLCWRSDNAGWPW
jgi:hypothetical protein